MELTKQVTSLELSKRLKELGVKQWSLFYWSIADDRKTMEIRYQTYVSEVNEETVPYYSAFTVAELGEMLPDLSPYSEEWFLHCIKTKTIKKPQETIWHSFYAPAGETNQRRSEHSDSNEANSRAKILIYLLENKLINIKE